MPVSPVIDPSEVITPTVSTQTQTQTQTRVRASTPVLEVTNLHIGYEIRGKKHLAVKGASLVVEAGETVALVGESGSGKTTTAHAIVGLLHHNARLTSGSIHLGHEDISSWSEKKLSQIRGRHVGFVPQDPGVSLNPIQRIGVQVVEALRIHGLATKKEAAAAAVELLRSANIENPEVVAHRYPSELSGGQRQRVLIAIALSCDPQLVIADEPTSALDVTVQQDVLDHLQKRTQALGAAMLFITHDLGVAVDRADRIAVMKDGQIVEEGVACEVLSNPHHEYTKALLAASPSLHSERIVATRLPVIPQLDCATGKQAATPRIHAEGLVKEFSTRIKDKEFVIKALDSVSFDIYGGRTTALVGASGSGKTTAARAILRLLDVSKGSITLDGKDVTNAKGRELRELRRAVQIVYQNPYSSLNPKMNVTDIIEAPLRAFKIGSKAGRKERVARLLEAVALPPSVAERLPEELSGGQRQRVAIARALAPHPQFIVLDEPVSALDVSVQDQILRLLVDVQAEFGIGYLFISHDLAVVRAVADSIYVLKKGIVIETGGAEAVFTNPQDPYTKELLEAIPGKSLGAT